MQLTSVGVVDAFGLNPGLVKTGIRSNFMGTGMLASFVESLISMFNITPEKYAEQIVPVIFSRELDGQSGKMFNQAGQAILPTPAMTNPEHVEALMAEAQALVQQGLAAELAA